MRRLPAAWPRRAVNHPRASFRWCSIRGHRAVRERVNRPEPDAGPDRATAAKARRGQACESIAAACGITRARAGQDLHEVRAIGAAAVGACGGRAAGWAAVRRARDTYERENRRQTGGDDTPGRPGP